MGFLIRSAFWLSLVLLLIPLGGQEANGDSVSPLQALSAAREAVGDIGGICERKPDVCVIGKAALHTIGIRAREASRLAFEALDDSLGETDGTTTGAVPPADLGAEPGAEAATR